MVELKGQSEGSRSGVIRPVLLAILVGSSIFFSLFFLLSPQASSRKYLEGIHEITSAPSARDASSVFASPPALPGPQNPQDPQEDATAAKRYDFRLSGTDTFYGIMSLFDVPASEMSAMIRKASPVYDLRRLMADTVLTVRTSGGKVEGVEYKMGDFEYLVIKKDAGAEGGYSAARAELPKEVRVELVSGVIESSLYEAGLKAGADVQAVLSLSDIFAWDVDFASDIRRGDTFKIYYETIYVDSRFVRSGRILGAEMVNDGRRFIAVYFEDSSGRGGYYDAEGRSLRRALLKSPLRYSRISSRFSRSRFHPILKRYRPHHGIDYAAPTGTPVEAAGGGRVLFAGWKPGYGYFVEIKHNNSYVTAYGHLSRIRGGVRAGTVIEQGDIVGYVGSTGISTGPHLHYEVKIAGRLVNPLTLKAEPNKSVNKAELPRFAAVKGEMIGRLSGASVLASNAREAAVK